jgi:hypothetical protein
MIDIEEKIYSKNTNLANQISENQIKLNNIHENVKVDTENIFMI